MYVLYDLQIKPKVMLLDINAKSIVSRYPALIGLECLDIINKVKMGMEWTKNGGRTVLK